MADAKIIISAVDQTKTAFDSVRRSLGSVNGLLAGFGAGISAAGLTAMVKGAIDFADEMGKAAQKVGVTTEALSGLKYAADLSDVSFETLQQGLKKLSVNMLEAATGGKEAGEAFKAVGIGVKDAQGNLRGADQVLADLSERFAKMPDGAEKTALAVKLLGKSGAELIPLLNAGADGLATMTAEAQKFGRVVSAESAAAAEQFNDNMERLKASLSGVGVSLANQLLPTLNETAQAMVDYAKSGDDAAASTDLFNIALQTLVVVAANVAYVFKQTGNEIGGIMAQLAALARFDFKGFSFIGDEMKADAAAARKALDDFEQRILNPQKKPSAAGAKPRAVTFEPDFTEARPKAGRASGKSAAVDQDAAAAARFVEQVQRQAETLGLSKEQLLAYESAHLKLTAAQRQSADAAIAQIAAFEQQEQAAKAAADAWKFLDEQATRQDNDALAQVEEDSRAAADALEDFKRRSYDAWVAGLPAAEQLELQIAAIREEAEKLGLSQDFADPIVAQMQKAAAETKTATDDITEFWREAARNMQNAVGDLFFDAMQGKLGNLEQSFKATIDRMVANLLASQLTTFLFGADFGKGGEIGGIAGDFGAWVKGALGFANGGIMTSTGPLPLHAYAGGGVATRPQLALFGEGSRPEAFVPLPDGRNIPVKMEGGGNITVNMHISNMHISTPDVGGFRKSMGQVAQEAQMAIGRGRRVS